MISDTSPFSAHQVGYLASFLARLLSRSDNSILVSRDVFTRVLDTLTQEQLGPGQRDERQQAVLDILQSDSNGWTYFDQTVLEEKCKIAGFYKVLEKLYQEQERYDDIIDCYLQDSTRQTLVFTWLAGNKVSEHVLLDRMESLLDIDVAKFASVIIKYNSDNTLLPKVLNKLNDDQKTMFEVLHHILEIPSQNVSKELYDQYLELMCQFNPEDVEEYLKNKDNHEYYDVAKAFKLCKEHKLTKAEVYLLERQGRISEAFKLLLSTLNNSITSNPENLDHENISDISKESNIVIEFCQRSSSSISAEDKEKMWCTLLDTCIKPLSLINTDLVPEWRMLVRNIVSSMLGHVSNSKVVSLIVSDPGYSSGSWSEVKHVIGDILETVRYETRLLQRTVATIRSETVDSTVKLVREKSRGVRSTSVTCATCHTCLNARDRSVVFKCHCVHHLQCLEESGGVTIRSNHLKQYKCTICSPIMNKVDQKCDTDNNSINLKTAQIERVDKAREFLKYYTNPDENEEINGFASSSIIKSENFSLKLKPGSKDSKKAFKNL